MIVFKSLKEIEQIRQSGIVVAEVMTELKKKLRRA